MPRGVVVHEMGSRLRVTWRWFSPAILFLVFFCVFWDGFLVFWYGVAFREGAPLIMKIVPLLHVLVGLGLTYGALCGLINRTTIEAVGGYLTVRHGPLPVPGNRRVEVHELAQLFVTEKIHHSRKTGISHTYTLWAKLTSGRRIKILPRIGEPDQAIFFEQQIERYLGIRDEPVRGELPR